MTATAAIDATSETTTAHEVALAARHGLTQDPRSLSPWLFYDEAGSELFEQITRLPEYYLTRTEYGLFEAHSSEILRALSSDHGKPASESKERGLAQLRPVTIAELGAGTATKTGILLRALAAIQPRVLYQPIDVSGTALELARRAERDIPKVSVRPCVANYVLEDYRVERPRGARVLALYIGSSIGNFAPQEAVAILNRLRSQLRSGDGLLLGADLAPNTHKSVQTLCAAYDDAQGVTAAFNRNVLVRLNRELGADFRPASFAHVARWNPKEARMEMHLESQGTQQVGVPANSAGPAFTLHFKHGETIHTENSYKFTQPKVEQLLASAGFEPVRTFMDDLQLFALTLAKVR